MEMEGQITPNSSDIFISGETDTSPIMGDDLGYYVASSEQIFAFDIIGQPVLAWTGEVNTTMSENVPSENMADDEVAVIDDGMSVQEDMPADPALSTYETVGDVNDLVLGPDGQALAVVLGVGGFLGIGEKEVAIDFERLSWTEVEGDMKLMLDVTREELEEAPAFDRGVIDDSDEPMAVSGLDTPEQQMTPVDTQEFPAVEEEFEVAESNDIATNTEMGQPAEIDGEWGPTTVEAYTAEELIGTPVQSAQNDTIGEISDVLLSEDGEQVEGFVVDVGGFLGFGEKPVAVATNSLDILVNAQGDLLIESNLTREELDSEPAFDHEAYANGEDVMLLSSL